MRRGDLAREDRTSSSRIHVLPAKARKQPGLAGSHPSFLRATRHQSRNSSRRFGERMTYRSFFPQPSLGQALALLAVDNDKSYFRDTSSGKPFHLGYRTVWIPRELMARMAIS